MDGQDRASDSLRRSTSPALGIVQCADVSTPKIHSTFEVQKKIKDTGDSNSVYMGQASRLITQTNLNSGNVQTQSTQFLL